MNAAERERRTRYEAEARGFRELADQRRAEGVDIEQIARELVARRNQLKLKTRADDRPERVLMWEARNLRMYGHPVGPEPEALLARYGDWEGVIAAACRPKPYA